MTKIMIVEDNKRARRALKALMSQQAGIDVTNEASNGQEAIQNMKQQTPEIVIMDICMPVMDGLEATKIIKANWPNVKVVILTMYPDHQAEALAAGADAFLIKGCSLDEVITLIHDFQARKMGNFVPIFNFPFVLVPPQI